MKANLSNSIYQRKNSSFGLTTKDGMLINNSIDDKTGIEKAIEVKKAIKRAEKISTLSEAVSIGNNIPKIFSF